jgi:hypothetical protein
MAEDDRYASLRGERHLRDSIASSESSITPLVPRRQSARSAATSLLPPSSPTSTTTSHSAYTSRSHYQARAHETQVSSDASTSQHFPRHSQQSGHHLPQARHVTHSRRPMNPPSLNLPPDVMASVPESLSSGVTRRPASPSNTVTSPTSPPRHPSARPSSRRALVAALSLAQEAVKLDTVGNDPQAAADAYARSVLLLREVMSRVSSGESAERDNNLSSNRRSRNLSQVTTREEEVKRLKSIVSHASYGVFYDLPANSIHSTTLTRNGSKSYLICTMCLYQT